MSWEIRNVYKIDPLSVVSMKVSMKLLWTLTWRRVKLEPLNL